MCMLYRSFLEAIEEKEKGKFDPNSVNWAVGENRIEVDDLTEDRGYRFENRVCIFMMGDGSQQVFGMFPLKGTPTPELWDVAERIIRTYMGVARVIRGAG